MQKTILDLIITASLFLFVTVLGMVGFGFLVAGVHLLLAAHLPAWAAALLTGSAVLLLAILVLLVFRLARGGRHTGQGGEPPGEARQGASRNAELLDLAIELAGKSGLNARDATLIALIAGTVVGVSPALRRQLLALLTGAEDEERTR